MSSKRSSSGKSDPLHDLNDYFQAIGEVSFAWAYFDGAVNGLIDIIHSSWGGDNIGEELPRTAFNRKIQYLRKWWNSDPANEIWFPQLPSALERAKELSDSRHWLLHGAMFEIEAFQETGVAILVKDDRKDAQHRVGATDIERIRDLRTELLGWTAMFGCFAMILEDPKGKGHEPFSKLAERFFRGLKRN